MHWVVLLEAMKELSTAPIDVYAFQRLVVAVSSTDGGPFGPLSGTQCMLPLRQILQPLPPVPPSTSGRERADSSGCLSGR